MHQGEPKKRLAFVIFIMVCALAAFSGVFSAYSWSQLKKITGDLRESTKELPRWRELAGRIKKINDEKKEAERVFIDEPDSQYQAFFDFESGKAGISKLKGIDPSRSSKFSEGLNQRVISVETEEATVKSLVTFLFAVQSGKPNLKITSIIMRPSKKNAGFWSCDVKITAYFRKG